MARLVNLGVHIIDLDSVVYVTAGTGSSTGKFVVYFSITPKDNNPYIILEPNEFVIFQNIISNNPL